MNREMHLILNLIAKIRFQEINFLWMNICWQLKQLQFDRWERTERKHWECLIAHCESLSHVAGIGENVF